MCKKFRRNLTSRQRDPTQCRNRQPFCNVSDSDFLNDLPGVCFERPTLHNQLARRSALMLVRSVKASSRRWFSAKAASNSVNGMRLRA